MKYYLDVFQCPLERIVIVDACINKINLADLLDVLEIASGEVVNNSDPHALFD